MEAAENSLPSDEVDPQFGSIKVMEVDGTTFGLDSLQPSTTISELKDKISLLKGFPKNRQRLIYRGKLLRNDDTCGQSKLVDGHTVHLVVQSEAAASRARAQTTPAQAPRPPTAPPMMIPGNTPNAIASAIAAAVARGGGANNGGSQPTIVGIPGNAGGQTTLSNLLSEGLSNARRSNRTHQEPPGGFGIHHIQQGLATLDTLVSAMPAIQSALSSTVRAQNSEMRVPLMNDPECWTRNSNTESSVATLSTSGTVAIDRDPRVAVNQQIVCDDSNNITPKPIEKGPGNDITPKPVETGSRNDITPKPIEKGSGNDITPKPIEKGSGNASNHSGDMNSVERRFAQHESHQLDEHNSAGDDEVLRMQAEDTSATELTSSSSPEASEHRTESLTGIRGDQVLSELSTSSTASTLDVAVVSSLMSSTAEPSRLLSFGSNRTEQMEEANDDLPTALFPNEFTTDESNEVVSTEHRKFVLGQWIDVKDTVNQWLEATVMRISQDKSQVFVHYNEWPTRWDEWIDVSSDRIAPFRTMTQPVSGSKFLSPTPLSWVPRAPSVGSMNLSDTLPTVRNYLDSVSILLRRVEELNNIVNQDQLDTVVSNADESQLDNSNLQHEEEKTTASASVQTAGVHAEELQSLTCELAPMLDRMGRMLADLGPVLQDRPLLRTPHDSNNVHAVPPNANAVTHGSESPLLQHPPPTTSPPPSQTRPGSRTTNLLQPLLHHTNRGLPPGSIVVNPNLTQHRGHRGNSALNGSQSPRVTRRYTPVVGIRRPVVSNRNQHQPGSVSSLRTGLGTNQSVVQQTSDAGGSLNDEDNTNSNDVAAVVSNQVDGASGTGSTIQLSDTELTQSDLGDTSASDTTSHSRHYRGAIPRFLGRMVHRNGTMSTNGSQNQRTDTTNDSDDNRTRNSSTSATIETTSTPSNTLNAVERQQLSTQVNPILGTPGRTNQSWVFDLLRRGTRFRSNRTRNASNRVQEQAESSQEQAESSQEHGSRSVVSNLNSDNIASNEEPNQDNSTIHAPVRHRFRPASQVPQSALASRSWLEESPVPQSLRRAPALQQLRTQQARNGSNPAAPVHTNETPNYLRLISGPRNPVQGLGSLDIHLHAVVVNENRNQAGTAGAATTHSTSVAGATTATTSGTGGTTATTLEAGIAAASAEPGTTATSEPGTTATSEPGTTATSEPGTTATSEPGTTTTTSEPGTTTATTSEPGTTTTTSEPGTTTATTSEPGTTTTTSELGTTAASENAVTTTTSQPGTTTATTSEPGTIAASENAATTATVSEPHATSAAMTGVSTNNTTTSVASIENTNDSSTDESQPEDKTAHQVNEMTESDEVNYDTMSEGELDQLD